MFSRSTDGKHFGDEVGSKERARITMPMATYGCIAFDINTGDWDSKLSQPHTVATLRDCIREDWLATHEDWLATGISTSFWRLVKTEHVRSTVPQSRKVAKSLDSVRTFATCRNWFGRRQPISERRALPNI